MQTMAQVLAGKSAELWSVAPDETVFDGLRLMAEKDVGALVVMERGRPIGMLSERDYARKVILRRRSSHSTPIRSIMTSAVETVTPDVTVEWCMSLMTRQRIRHVLVTRGDELCGIVSIGDLVKATIDDQQFTIVQLERYIGS